MEKSPFRIHQEVFILQALGDAGGLFGLDLFGGGAHSRRKAEGGRRKVAGRWLALSARPSVIREL